MSTNEMTLFFVMLAFGGFIVVVAALLLGLWRLVTGALPEPVAAFVGSLRPYAIGFAFVAAFISMAGSLYYSEVAGFDPCRNCWYQRFMMYPAAILLGLTMVTKRMILAKIAFVMSVVGICISTYHRLEQQFPENVGGACALDNPCSSRYVNEFGFVTIPTMAWVGFALVIVFAGFALVNDRTSRNTTASASSLGDTQ